MPLTNQKYVVYYRQIKQLSSCSIVVIQIERGENVTDTNNAAVPGCETNEVHPDILKRVQSTLPEDTDLNRLAELYKVFGDTTRINSLCALADRALRMRPCGVTWCYGFRRIAPVTGFEAGTARQVPA